MSKQLEDQMTGRMMLARLGGAISFVGRSAFFLSVLASAFLIGGNIINLACGNEYGERGLYEATQQSVVMVVGAFALLVVCSAICWIITGVGDLLTFLLYLIGRVGTFAMSLGLAFIGVFMYARYIIARCGEGSAFWIVVAGVGAIVVGLIIQFSAQALFVWYREKLEEAQLRARGTL